MKTIKIDKEEVMVYSSKNGGMLTFSLVDGKLLVKYADIVVEVFQNHKLDFCIKTESDVSE